MYCNHPRQFNRSIWQFFYDLSVYLYLNIINIILLKIFFKKIIDAFIRRLHIVFKNLHYI